MAQSADALHGDEIAGARARIAERVENGNAGTKRGAASAAGRSSGMAATASAGVTMYSW
jgi:hypothetical protein